MAKRTWFVAAWFVSAWVVSAGAAVLAGLAAAGAAQAQTGRPETASITIGLSINDSTFLPVYIADAAALYKAEGLDVKVLTFRGGSDLTRALVAGSVNIGVAAPTSVLSAITAGENVKVFFGGFNQSPFFWYAVPPIKTIADMRGKRIGITRFGSSTDALTRFVLSMGKLDPKADVRIVQGGGSAERLVAMETKQVDVGVFTWPHNFIAEDRGYNLIARQSDFMPDFPIQSFFAMQVFLDKNPQTVRASLRAFVKAVRLIRSDRALAVRTLVARAALEEKHAARAYDQLLEGWREDGRLATEDGMKRFFDMAIASGEVDSMWPREKYWDNRFAATMDQWRP